MAITNGYATLDEYKKWIVVRGGSAISTDANDDAMIELLIESVSRFIDAETATKFYLPAIDETRYFTAVESDKVYVGFLASLTSISVDYAGTRTYTDLTATDYDLTPDNASLDGVPYTAIETNKQQSSAYFPRTRRGVKVVGKWGWPATPKDIKEATLSIAQSLYATRSGQTAGGKVTITAGGIVIRPEDVPAFAQKVIMHYRNIL